MAGRGYQTSPQDTDSPSRSPTARLHTSSPAPPTPEPPAAQPYGGQVNRPRGRGAGRAPPPQPPATLPCGPPHPAQLLPQLLRRERHGAGCRLPAASAPPGPARPGPAWGQAAASPQGRWGAPLTSGSWLVASPRESPLLRYILSSGLPACMHISRSKYFWSVTAEAPTQLLPDQSARDGVSRPHWQRSSPSGRRWVISALIQV